MELKDFVRDSIVQILTGVKEAATVATELGAVVNPTPALPAATAQNYRVGEGTNLRYAAIEGVEFDVAVTAIEKEGDKATIGVLAAIVGAGLASESDHSHQTTSRIRFRVPIGMPLGRGDHYRPPKVTGKGSDW